MVSVASRLQLLSADACGHRAHWLLELPTNTHGRLYGTEGIAALAMSCRPCCDCACNMWRRQQGRRRGPRLGPEDWDLQEVWHFVSPLAGGCCEVQAPARHARPIGGRASVEGTTRGKGRCAPFRVNAVCASNTARAWPHKARKSPVARAFSRPKVHLAPIICPRGLAARAHSPYLTPASPELDTRPRLRISVRAAPCILCPALASRRHICRQGSAEIPVAHSPTPVQSPCLAGTTVTTATRL